jgi:outer-membrane receptor for ferric coprogen and ferric-rhodotorulic acid
MFKHTCVVLAGTAALGFACLPASAQSTSGNDPVKVGPVVVEGKAPKKAKKKTPASASASGQTGDAVSGAQAKPPSIRDTRADTQGTKSYATGATTAGSKEPRGNREVPQSVSVVTRQQMEDQNLNTFWDAMTYAPGVTIVANNPDQGQYYARGYALGVAFDGVPSYNALSGYQQFDTALYDRIEVLRGPDGLFMGAGRDPAGVVNLVRKRPLAEAGVAWSTSYGSWNNKHGEIDVTTPLNESKTLRFRGVLAGTDKEFFFDDADENRKLAYGVLEYDVTPRTLFTIAAVQQNYLGPSYSGLPAWDTATTVPADLRGRFTNLSRETNVYPSWTYLKWNSREYSSSVEHKFDNEWRVKVSARELEQSFHFNDAYPTTGVNPATMTATYAQRNAIYDYERIGVDAYVEGPFYLFGQKHNLMFGYNYDSFTSDGVRSANDVTANVPVLNPDSLARKNLPFTRGSTDITEQSGFYGQARIKLLDDLTAIGGGRVTDFENRSRNHAPSIPTAWSLGAHESGEITPYGALIYDINKNISIYGSYADIFVPQTAKKWTGEVLDPRVGAQYEVGIKGEFLNKRMQTSLALFDIRDVNRAFKDDAHSTPSETFYLQLGEAESKGLDASVTGKVLPGLEITSGYTYLYTELVKAYSSQGTSISNWFPKHTFKTWAKYEIQNEDWKRWSVGAGVIVLSAFEANGTSVRRQEPYAVVNAMISYQIDKTMSASLSVNNIFDEAYYTRIGGTNTYNTYGEPRNYMLTLRKSFQ